MQELVEYIVQRLVDNPDQVTVSAVETDRAVVYEVTVAEEDLGQVIGRGGRIANALRTLVRAVPTSDDMRYTVEILS